MTRGRVLWEMKARAKCRLVATILINPCDEHHTEKMESLCLRGIWQICACLQYGKLRARIAGFCEQIKVIAIGKLSRCSYIN